MRTAVRAAVALVMLAFVAEPEESWAAHGRGASAGRSGRAHHPHHAHHGRGVAYVGIPLLYPWPYPGIYPPPYYYGPDFLPRYEPPTMYVEQFTGTPTPEMQAEIYWPEKAAHYPEVKECPGGWQRIIHITGATMQGAGAAHEPPPAAK